MLYILGFVIAYMLYDGIQLGIKHQRLTRDLQCEQMKVRFLQHVIEKELKQASATFVKS